MKRTEIAYPDVFEQVNSLSRHDEDWVRYVRSQQKGGDLHGRLVMCGIKIMAEKGILDSPSEIVYRNDNGYMRWDDVLVDRGLPPHGSPIQPDAFSIEHGFFIEAGHPPDNGYFEERCQDIANELTEDHDPRNFVFVQVPEDFPETGYVVQIQFQTSDEVVKEHLKHKGEQWIQEKRKKYQRCPASYGKHSFVKTGCYYTCQNGCGLKIPTGMMDFFCYKWGLDKEEQMGSFRVRREGIDFPKKSTGSYGPNLWGDEDWSFDRLDINFEEFEEDIRADYDASASLAN